VDQKKRQTEQGRGRTCRDMEQAIASEAAKLRREMEDRFQEVERHNATENLKKEIEALKDVLASRSPACQERSPSRSLSADDDYGYYPRGGRSPDCHHIPESYERRSHEYGRGAPGSRREYADNSSWGEESAEYEIPRGRTRQKTLYPMSGRRIIRDDYYSRDHSDEVIQRTVLRDRSRTPAPYRMSGGIKIPFTEEQEDNVVSRSVSRNRTRCRTSFGAARWASFSPVRHSYRTRSPQLDTGERRRRHMREKDGWETRMTERIRELERRVQVQEQKASEERQRERMDAERNKLRLLQAQREAQERKRSRPPTRRVFKPGRGVKEESSSKPIELVDHLDLHAVDHERVGKRSHAHQDHHQHHRRRQTLG